MCGIFGVLNDSSGQAAQSVLQGLKKLEYRGYDSWGIAVIPLRGKRILVDKHVGKIGQARTNLLPATIGIGHTRWATHGGVTDNNAHPHLDCHQKLAVIHNGIVENYQELKEKLTAAGHIFKSETDTEVVAHLIEENAKTGSVTKAVFTTFNHLVGSNAVAVLDFENKNIIACRNGSPLVVGFGQGEFFLASDVPPFLKSTNKVHFLNDGEGVVISGKGVKIYDLKTKKPKTPSIKVLDWKVEDAEKGGYPHFLLKEIMEQPQTIAKTATINERELAAAADKIIKANKVVAVACGTASYCALAAKYLFAGVGVNLESYGAYEFLPFLSFVDKRTVVLAISQSGETADTIIAAKAAKSAGAYIVAVVNARGSTLERLADAVLPVGAGPEMAVVSTKAFTAQLATLYLLAQTAVGKYVVAKMKIIKLGATLENWLSKKLLLKITRLAKELINEEDLYLIGKYLNYPAALEFALKIKETSYLHAEPFAAGELKHGVITLIQKGTPCLVLASEDTAKREVLSSAAELKARGGKIIGIAPFPAAEFDRWICTPDLSDLTLFPNIIVGQLLGYYLGVGRGTDPDKPRNLAKSVTVK